MGSLDRGQIHVKQIGSSQTMGRRRSLAYNSGRKGSSSLWFANLLGALSKTQPVPHSVYCRQALIGGNYELIQHQTLIPNPDYWVAYLWKQLVGTKAVGPIQSPQREDSIMISSMFTFGCCDEPGYDLVHSFCAKSTGNAIKGDVVFIIINISNEAINLSIPIGKQRAVYRLCPNSEGYQSRQVLLNGNVLTIENVTLLEIHGRGLWVNQPIT